MEANQQPRPRPIGPRGFFTGVRIRPVVVGAVVDYVASYLLIMLYLIAYHVKDLSDKGGVPQEAIEKALEEALSSQDGLFALMVIGAFGTALGGYVAARLAGSEQVKHGALVGAISLIIGAVQGAISGGPGPAPYWYELLGFILAIPAGALGGSFARSSSIERPEGP